MQVPIAKPYLGEEEKKAVNAVLNSGWLVQGAKVSEFEKMICQFTGAAFAKASSSCTTALHLALIVLGIGKGDEVLVPSFTFVASANAIEYTGAKPVFVDIDLDTFCIDPNKVGEQLGKHGSRFKAIMPVHLFGLSANMQSIVELANHYGLFIIEDAACALGSSCYSTQAGRFGDIGCFSFHPRKSITTGEGGMLVTNNPAIANSVSSLRNHGAAVSDFDRHEQGGYLLPAFDVLGYNYRMTDMQAAIGVEQMKKLDWIISQRIQKARRYDKALGHIECIRIPYAPEGYKHTYQSYVIMLIPKKQQPTLDVIEELSRTRNKIMAKLAEKGIATRQGTSAVHQLGYYRNKYKLKVDDHPFSLMADRHSITLPLYPQMTNEEQDYVIENLHRELKHEFS
jgi:dTDP-4-amino-4,6-dideoxygalactose transaminase